MVQEVQQQGNWYQTPNRIEGVWVSERKISDHTQVRADRTNGCYASTTMRITKLTEVKSTSWTITWDSEVKYRAIGGTIYIPLPWTYLFRFTLANWYSVAYALRFRIYEGNRVIYTYNTDLSDKSEHEVMLNFGRKNEISISLYMTGGNTWEILNVNPQIQLIKL